MARNGKRGTQFASWVVNGAGLALGFGLMATAIAGGKMLIDGVVRATRERSLTGTGNGAANGQLPPGGMPQNGAPMPQGQANPFYR